MPLSTLLRGRRLRALRNGRRLPRALAVGLAAGALAAGPASAAFADGPPAGWTADLGPRLVKVHMSSSGFSLPSRVHAGFIDFRTTTNDAQGHTLQGVQLHKGVSFSRLLADLRQATSQTPSTSAAGIRAAARDATVVGGAAVEPSTFVSVSIPLTAGTYYFFDFNQLFVPGGKVTAHKLLVHGTFDTDTPAFGATITQVETKNGPRFIAPRHIDTDSTILIRNRADEIHEALFSRVNNGVTDATLQKYFDLTAQGKTAPNPFAENAQRGAAAMSPGRIELLHFDPRGGHYALLCFIPDDKSGIPHAFLGMHKVIRLS
ncbi:hypothetical protein [Streptacidiphilus carbonis]|uniref:hypothetical protein n=1 Tax=Streptacidiphilus carbonis TaxID=105422 RepID=UPI001269B7F4|nr:hypothetical protein [Streptacidiphilus carbonis]